MKKYLVPIIVGVCVAILGGTIFSFTKTKYIAKDTVISGQNYNNCIHTTHHGDFWLDDDALYYSQQDILYNTRLFGVDKTKRCLAENLSLPEGNIKGDIQVYEKTTYFPVCTDNGTLLFYRKKAEEKPEEILSVQATLGNWAVFNNTLIYADHGDDLTYPNHALYACNLTTGEKKLLSSNTNGFSIVNSKLYFIAPYQGNHAVFTYDFADGDVVLYDTFAYYTALELLGVTKDRIVMRVRETENTDVLVYNLNRKSMDTYTLPWEIWEFSAYNEYAFLSFYDSQAGTQHIPGLYCMDLQTGNLQLLEENVNMPTTLFSISDTCVYFTAEKMQMGLCKTVLYRFSKENTKAEKIYSW